MLQQLPLRIDIDAAAVCQEMATRHQADLLISADVKATLKGKGYINDPSLFGKMLELVEAENAIEQDARKIFSAPVERSALEVTGENSDGQLKMPNLAQVRMAEESIAFLAGHIPGLQKMHIQGHGQGHLQVNNEENQEEPVFLTFLNPLSLKKQEPDHTDSQPDSLQTINIYSSGEFADEGANIQLSVSSGEDIGIQQTAEVKAAMHLAYGVVNESKTLSDTTGSFPSSAPQNPDGLVVDSSPRITAAPEGVAKTAAAGLSESPRFSPAASVPLVASVPEHKSDLPPGQSEAGVKGQPASGENNNVRADSSPRITAAPEGVAVAAAPVLPESPRFSPAASVPLVASVPEHKSDLPPGQNLAGIKGQPLSGESKNVPADSLPRMAAAPEGVAVTAPAGLSESPRFSPAASVPLVASVPEHKSDLPPGQSEAGVKGQPSSGENNNVRADSSPRITAAPEGVAKTAAAGLSESPRFSPAASVPLVASVPEHKSDLPPGQSEAGAKSSSALAEAQSLPQKAVEITREGFSIPTQLPVTDNEAIRSTGLLKQIASPHFFGAVKEAYSTHPSRIKLVLTPPQLGNMEIVLQLKGGKMNLVLTVDSHDVRQALLSNSDGLRQSLQHQGITIDIMTVALRDEPHREGLSQGQGGPGHAHERDDSSSDDNRRSKTGYLFSAEEEWGGRSEEDAYRISIFI